MARKNRFYEFATTVQEIAETRSHNEKDKICREYLVSLSNERDLKLAVRYLSEGAFTRNSGKRTSVGGHTLATSAADFCNIDYDKVFKPCRTATGSTSETIEKLMGNVPDARRKWDFEALTLEQVSTIYEKLYHASARDEKQQILSDSWSRMVPLEMKYFIRIMRRGSLRIGFESKSVVNAIAHAFGKPEEDIRYTHMITGNIAKTAILAKNERLDDATFQLHQPISFMLASPIDSRSVKRFDHYVAEEKFDGMRAQVHISSDQVSIFSRDLNDITSSFPEIVTFFLSRNISSMVLDGEICVFRDNKIQPFQLLQKRMGVKEPDRPLLQKYPVLFIAYDILHDQGKSFFDRTLSERRQLLEQKADYHQFPITNQFEIKKKSDIDTLFDRAVEHGNEGLVVKDTGSPYEYGHRGKSWLKVKKPGGSLDTIIMYAHSGSGKRGGLYSDFTLGIRVDEDERYEEEFIPIGKAYGGYTDEELKKLNERVNETKVARYGPTLALEPDILVEIEFDDIQMNKRTKANFTLRLPRFRAIRWNLGPRDADTLKDVERLYQQRIDRKRSEQTDNPSFHYFGKNANTN